MTGAAVFIAWLFILFPASGVLAARRVSADSPPQEPSRPQATQKITEARTIESADSRLARALAAQKTAETSERLQAVAAEYSRLGVYDQAIAVLTRALKTSPRDAALFAARARAWRDWAQPDLGLGDATRATFFAPGSADAHNTLGTIQFALNHRVEAQASFERALGLSPDAPWVLNNLCYVALIGGDEAAAMTKCTAALDRDPASTAARNNLALVHAAAGRLPEARALFLGSGNPAAGHYNIGIVLMARREYAAAADAFRESCRLTPAFDAACRRATEARLLARGGSAPLPR